MARRKGQMPSLFTPVYVCSWHFTQSSKIWKKGVKLWTKNIEIFILFLAFDGNNSLRATLVLLKQFFITLFSPFLAPTTYPIFTPVLGIFQNSVTGSVVTEVGWDCMVFSRVYRNLFQATFWHCKRKLYGTQIGGRFTTMTNKSFG